MVFPNLSLEEVESNFEGMVNDVLIVNGVRVFRFPKSEWAREMQKLGNG